MKKIVLFDMDGTLTPARKKMERKVLNALTDLQNADFEIGIVTGSDLNYVQQQMEIALDISPLDAFQIHFLPCNGTKYYRLGHGGFLNLYEKDMRNELGEENWRVFIQTLCNLQSSLTSFYNHPLTGNFINYRGSMVNWCPIGRQATTADREEWCGLDKEQRVRETWLWVARMAMNNIGLEDVVIKLGGDTSFDIYPKGWDKTFAFNNFSEYDKIYFIGDRCEPQGNDHEAYLLAGDLGYSTTGPNQTINIIKEIIKKEGANA